LTPAHVLAIARREPNTPLWLEGGFYGLASRSTRLQDRVVKGGTLWVVVSRRGTGSKRSYSLAFRLVHCKHKHYEGSEWPNAVVGDRDRSRLFASNDARLLLMSLRFEPFAPIRNAGLIGQSIQTPRLLSADDVSLLEEHGASVNRWSVFVSYDHRDEASARRLSDSLARLGINVFRDHEALRPGQEWPGALEHAIRSARHFVLLVGRHTLERPWVKKELRLALGSKRITIIPVLAGGKLEDWETEFPGLSAIQALEYGSPSWGKFVDRLLRELRVRSVR
jgi:TIR domain-containing protein